jgi:potassium-transporting ATPase potassium-binding subunit
MNTTTAAIVMIAVLVAVLAIVHVPFGDYMARVYTSPRHLRVERGMYRLVGVDPEGEQTWGVYARSVLAFSAVSVLFLYLFQRVQSHLPLNLGFSNVPSALAFNTAASFVTNTNWQAYSGESTLGHLVDGGELAGHADRGAYPVGLGHDVVTGDPDGAGVRGQQRGQDLHGGRLA